MKARQIAFSCMLVLGTVALMAAPLPSRAADEGETPDAGQVNIAEQRALDDLAQDFANKMDASLKRANLYLSGAGKLPLAELKAQTALPDNEPLLLHINFTRDRIAGTQDVYSMKRGTRLLVSLGDFALATGLAITVKPTEGTASGWFIRQTQSFALDANKRQVTIQGRAASIAPEDLESDGRDILVSSDLLEKWFDVEFTYDFANLAIEVTTTKPFPVEEAYVRGKKSKSRYFGDAAPSLPYLEPAYAMASLPYLDTNINARLIHFPNEAPLKFANWSSILSGDIAGFSAQGFFAGTAKEPYLDSLRLTLGKEDVDGNLLGPLHARKYQFGDVDTVSNALIGGGGIGLGVSVSSKINDGITTETSAPIHGDAQPGWDVELYRNNVYIDIRHIGVDGRYDFGDVDLVVGDNDFKFLFFGPQGETREEHRNIGVTPGAVAKNTGNYAFSATRKGLGVWQKEVPRGDDIGHPHLSAKYEYGVPHLGTVKFGALGDSVQGEYKALLSTGLATYFNDIFFNFDAGYDSFNNAFAGATTARRNFAGQSLLLQYSMNSKEFNPGSTVVGAAVRDSYRASLGGTVPISQLQRFRPSYSLFGSYTNLYSTGKSKDLGASLSASVKSILFSTNVGYNQTTVPATEITPITVTESMTGNTTANGFLWNGSWRLGADYTFIPTNRLTSIDADYTHSIGEKVDATASINYQPDPKVVTGTVSLNFQTPVATISPVVRADNRHNASIGVNVHFAAAADPYSHDYDIYNKYLAQAGGLAARVYMDKNGDGEYNTGDEPLPDVVVRALQQHRNASSDARGIAFIPDLEKNVLTDVIVDSATFPDSYGTSLFQGVSIRPHAGGVTKLEFPVVIAGEMDGQASFINDKGVSESARNLRVSLIAPDGRVEGTAVAASDGYWALSAIRPGIYYLVTEGDGSTPGYHVPELIEFTAQGSTYFGRNITLKPGYDTNFRFASDNAAPDGPRHTRVIRPGDLRGHRTALSLGGFHSRLTMTLAWYKLRHRSAGWGDGYDLATPIGKIQPDPKTGKLAMSLIPKETLGIDHAAAECQSLQAMGYTCTVTVTSKYIDALPPIDKTEPVLPEPKEEDIPVAAAPEAEAPEKAVEPVKTYANITPALKSPAPATQTAILNLGSYNSKPLMMIMWYKLKTRHGGLIAGTVPTVDPKDIKPAAETGQYTLRLTLRNYNLEEARNRCKLLIAQKLACTVEVQPTSLSSTQ